MKTLTILLLTLVCISIFVFGQNTKTAAPAPGKTQAGTAARQSAGPGASATPESPIAVSSPTTQGPGSTPAPHEMTEADVSAFIDGILPQQLQQDDVAGAAVAVVKDGKVLFEKGYGYADVAKKQPVSADTTLFRCGSVSKLFTWTAVMQLQEQGKLDLD
ncbi:MAG: serine hydrolase domain-containing protein, partial [Blastocatellia bacterium]